MASYSGQFLTATKSKIGDGLHRDRGGRAHSRVACFVVCRTSRNPTYGALGTHNVPHLHPITPDLYLLLTWPLFIEFHADGQNRTVNSFKLKIMVPQIAPRRAPNTRVIPTRFIKLCSKLG